MRTNTRPHTQELIWLKISWLFCSGSRKIWLLEEDLQQHAINLKVNIHLLTVLNTSQESKNNQNPPWMSCLSGFLLKKTEIAHKCASTQQRWRTQALVELFSRCKQVWLIWETEQLNEARVCVCLCVCRLLHPWIQSFILRTNLSLFQLCVPHTISQNNLLVWFW